MTNQELLALVKKHPIGFGCGALCLVLGVTLYFRSGAIPEAESQLEQKSALAERYRANVTYSAQLQEQLEAVTAANAAINERVIFASQLGVNYGLFQKLIKDTGVVFADFGQTTPANAPKPKTAFLPVAFRITVQGELRQLLDFLRAIESGPHYSRVLTANVSGNPTERGGKLTLALTLELLGQP